VYWCIICISICLIYWSLSVPNICISISLVYWCMCRSSVCIHTYTPCLFLSPFLSRGVYVCIHTPIHSIQTFEYCLHVCMYKHIHTLSLSLSLSHTHTLSLAFSVLVYVYTHMYMHTQIHWIKSETGLLHKRGCR